MHNQSNLKFPEVLTKELDFSKILDRTASNVYTNILSEEFFGKIIMVTGAAGSIGKNLVIQLCQFQPKILILVDQSESSLFELLLQLQDLNFKVYAAQLGDIRNKRRMEKLFDLYHPDIVFHAAAYKHVPLMENNPFEAVSVNVAGTKNLVDLSISYGVEKFVFISSDKAINPSSVMGATKRLGELYIHSVKNNAKTIFITTRFANVIGSSGSIVPILINQISKGGPVTITHKEATRYFLTMKDAILLVLESTATAMQSHMFLFEMGQPINICDLAAKILTELGINKSQIDIQICGLRQGEKIHEELSYSNAIPFGSSSNKLFTLNNQVEDAESIKLAIEMLLKNLDSFSHLEIVSKIKSIVPEYISINSKYDILDRT